MRFVFVKFLYHELPFVKWYDFNWIHVLLIHMLICIAFDFLLLCRFAILQSLNHLRKDVWKHFVFHNLKVKIQSTLLGNVHSQKFIARKSKEVIETLAFVFKLPRLGYILDVLRIRWWKVSCFGLSFNRLNQGLEVELAATATFDYVLQFRWVISLINKFKGIVIVWVALPQCCLKLLVW